MYQISSWSLLIFLLYWLKSDIKDLILLIWFVSQTLHEGQFLSHPRWKGGPQYLVSLKIFGKVSLKSYIIWNKYPKIQEPLYPYILKIPFKSILYPFN